MTFPTHPTGLARLARSAVADASDGTLLIHGIGRLAPGLSAVVLPDEDGQPMFWCAPGSPIAVAAARARPALLTIPVRSGGLSVTVVLAGRLTLVPVGNIYGAQTDVVALDLDQVFVERGGPTKPSLAKYEVPLEIYIESQPDPIGDYGAQIIEHANLAHHCELRDFVAARHGVPSEAIAGAILVALDETGGRVHWVDADGAHATTVTFPEPARTPSALAEMLRSQLARPYQT